MRKMHELANARSIIDEYNQEGSDESKAILSVRVEESLIEDLETITENIPMLKDRSVLVRNLLRNIVREEDLKEDITTSVLEELYARAESEELRNAINTVQQELIQDRYQVKDHHLYRNHESEARDI